MAMLKKPYRESTERNMPRQWFDPLPHTHLALDDAVEQGAILQHAAKEHLAPSDCGRCLWNLTIYTI